METQMQRTDIWVLKGNGVSGMDWEVCIDVDMCICVYTHMCIYAHTHMYILLILCMK